MESQHTAVTRGAVHVHYERYVAVHSFVGGRVRGHVLMCAPASIVDAALKNNLQHHAQQTGSAAGGGAVGVVGVFRGYIVRTEP